MDNLNAFHPLCTLGQWVKKARDYGSTPEIKDYYEMNARRLITTWGGNLNDYADRSWSGLVGDYYAYRWQIYIDEGINSVKEHRAFNDEARSKATHDYEQQWAVSTHKPWTVAADKSNADLLTFSRLLSAKWAARLPLK